jgi:hypothetical protein
MGLLTSPRDHHRLASVIDAPGDHFIMWCATVAAVALHA